jgi:hypothetical protein
MHEFNRQHTRDALPSVPLLIHLIARLYLNQMPKYITIRKLLRRGPTTTLQEP